MSAHKIDMLMLYAKYQVILKIRVIKLLKIPAFNIRHNTNSKKYFQIISKIEKISNYTASPLSHGFLKHELGYNTVPL